ncbi:unannotated protein [freshwater metagenome]|uniref:Unannotated protein n=1 Tax=freshwater metagenome TaxID=449393 RepID=A0A6J7G8V6_9ZZZZ
MLAEVLGDPADITDHEVRQHVSTVQVGTVPNQWCFERGIPESRDHRAHEQGLHHRHLMMRRHLESAKFEQTEPAAGGVGAVQLVDAELGTVRVPGDVGEQVPQRPIDDPRRCRTVSTGQTLDLAERNLELVERLLTTFVGSGGLRGGTDESTREQVRQRRVTLPVCQQRHQQVRSAQHRRIGRCDATQSDVVATAGAAGGAVVVETLGTQP